MTKLLPAFGKEHLPVVVSYANDDIAVSRLDNSSGNVQAQTVWKAILDWNFADKIQILCWGFTAPYTGSMYGARVLLEQQLDEIFSFIYLTSTNWF